MGPNPFRQPDGSWWFLDEEGEPHGPYKTDQKVTKALLDYCYWLEHGPTRWQSIKWPVQTFFRRIKFDLMFWRLTK